MAARDLTLEAASSVGPGRNVNYRSSTRELSFTQVKKLLESRHDREILDGLRRIVAMVCQSRDALPYFSSVVKNVASSNLDIKKLVYFYILHYAESDPDLALLSINTIQRSLSDQNPQVRTLALRVMSGIRVPVISQIVSLAIKKGSGDMSPHVRKVAALAIPKCYRLDPGTLPQLLEYLATLLGDRQYYVVGAAVAAFLEICPDNISLIHQHFRSLVRKLVDMDEWGQIAVLRLLTDYSRKCIPRMKSTGRKRATEDGLLGAKDDEGGTVALDPDLELFLKSCKSLLNSRNPAVVLDVLRAYVYLAPLSYLDAAIAPLVALLRSPPDMHQTILYNFVVVCLMRPAAFVPYANRFFVRSSDHLGVSTLKIELQTLIFPHADAGLKGIIINELEHFTTAPDTALAKESVRAIGRCTQVDPTTSSRCMALLLNLASSPDDAIVSEALSVVRQIIQHDPANYSSVIVQLAKHLDTINSPVARASILWLVGEYGNPQREEDSIAPDVLRLLARGFADESEPVKLQIVRLAAKVYLRHLLRQDAKAGDGRQSPVRSASPAAEGVEEGFPGTASEPTPPHPEHTITILWRYILLLVRYDTSYDIRDVARTYDNLLSDPTDTQLAQQLLLAPKPAPLAPSPSVGRADRLLGSASLVMGLEAGATGLPGYVGLPSWAEPGDEPDSRLREEAVSQRSEAKPVPASRMLGAGQQEAAASSAPSSSKVKTLDDWLAEEDPPPKRASAQPEESDESEGTEGTKEETDDEEDEEDGLEGEGIEEDEAEQSKAKLPLLGGSKQA